MPLFKGRTNGKNKSKKTCLVNFTFPWWRTQSFSGHRGCSHQRQQPSKWQHCGISRFMAHQLNYFQQHIVPATLRVSAWTDPSHSPKLSYFGVTPWQQVTCMWTAWYCEIQKRETTLKVWEFVWEETFGSKLCLTWSNSWKTFGSTICLCHRLPQFLFLGNSWLTSVTRDSK